MMPANVRSLLSTISPKDVNFLGRFLSYFGALTPEELRDGKFIFERRLDLSKDVIVKSKIDMFAQNYQKHMNETSRCNNCNKCEQ